MTGRAVQEALARCVLGVRRRLFAVRNAFTGESVAFAALQHVDRLDAGKNACTTLRPEVRPLAPVRTISHRSRLAAFLCRRSPAIRLTIAIPSCVSRAAQEAVRGRRRGAPRARG